MKYQIGDTVPIVLRAPDLEVELNATVTEVDEDGNALRGTIDIPGRVILEGIPGLDA